MSVVLLLVDCNSAYCALNSQTIISYLSKNTVQIPIAKDKAGGQLSQLFDSTSLGKVVSKLHLTNFMTTSG